MTAGGAVPEGRDRRTKYTLIAIAAALVAVLVVPVLWDRYRPADTLREAGREQVKVSRVLPQRPAIGEGRYKPDRPNKVPTPPVRRVEGNVPPGAVEAATRYINATENMESYMHTDPAGWVGTVRPLMTGYGWDGKYGNFRAGAGASGGAAWRLAQQKKIKVDTEVDCQHYPVLGKPTEKSVGLTCTVIDKPVYANGQPVPVAELTPAWTRTGVRPAYRLAMTNDGGWKVAADATGRA